MINNMLFVIVAVMLVTEAVLMVALFMVNKKIKDHNWEYEFIKKILKTDSEMIDKMSTGISEEAEVYEKMYSLVDNMSKQYTTILSSYEKILEAYTIVSNGYKEMNGNYKKLLQCWKEVADKYDDSCEQFEKCADALLSFKRVLDPWCLDSDQLGQACIDQFGKDDENPFLEDVS